MMKDSTLFLALLAASVSVGCATEKLQNPNSSVASSPFTTAKERPTDSYAPEQDTELAAAGDQLIDDNVVQEDVRKMVSAVYNADVDTVLGYTHPKIIEKMGGKSQAKSVLNTTFSKFQSLGMKVDSMTFPNAPTFLKSDVNHFVIVPTLSIISANGQRAESLNYQFGIREIGTTKWKYIEGSRINKQNVKMLFPDFPADYEFPEFYRRKL